MKIDVFENGITAWKEAIAALEKIINGDLSYSNYRLFVLSFQNAIELFFKKMLLDKNEFMIFSFDKFKDQVLDRYKNACKDGKSIFEYALLKNKGKLPDTVKFNESYKRLAYLYNMKCFTDEVIANLEVLGDLRNNIMHFEVQIEDEVLASLSKLLLSCDEMFQDNITDYGWGDNYISDSLRKELEQKDLNMNKLIANNPINRRIMDTIIDNTGSFVEIDIEDYVLLADIYLMNNSQEKLSRDDISKRFEMLVRHGFIEQESYSFSYGEDHMDSISVVQVSDKGKLYLTK